MSELNDTQDFYEAWRERFDKLRKLGIDGVLALPNTTFDEWLYYFKNWSKVYSEDYASFKTAVDETIRTMADGYNKNTSDYNYLKAKFEELKTATAPNVDLNQRLQQETQSRQALESTVNTKLTDLTNQVTKQLSDAKTETDQMNSDTKSMLDGFNADLTEKLSQMKLNIEVLDNLNAISTKYPNGAMGVFVAGDTGHQYAYIDGQWKDLGTVINLNQTIKPADLSDELLSALSLKTEWIKMDEVKNEYVDSSKTTFTQVQNTDAKLMHSQRISVQPGDLFYLYAASYYDARPFVIFDGNNNRIYRTDIPSQDKLWDGLIRVPNGASYMYVNSKISSAYHLIKITGFQTKPQVLTNNYNWKDIPLTKVYTKKYFTGIYKGLFVDIDNIKLGVSQYIPVSTGDVFKVSGTGYWEASLVIGFTIDGTIVNNLLNQPNAVQTYSNQVFTIPEGVVGIVIQPYDTAYSLQKAEFVEPGSGQLSPTGNLSKKVCIIGDSWSAYNTLEYNNRGTNWVRRLPLLAQVKYSIDLDVDNTAIGGTGFVAGNGDANQIYSTRTISNDADLYVVLGSFNDYYQAGMTIGTLGGTTEKSIYKGMMDTYNHIKTVNPDARMVMISPGPWASHNQVTSGNDVKTFDEAYVTAMQTFANHYSIPFFDFYHNSMLRPWDADYVNSHYHGTNETDGTHLNTKGNDVIAPILANFICNNI